jgi:glycosyltransferase involved in cell wall biosynthesis
MACWCPVIASDIWPFREICDNNELIVNHKNRKEIITKISKFLSDERYWRELSAYWKKRSSLFNWRKNSDNLLNIVNS